MSNDISPSYVRDRRLALTLAPNTVPTANVPLVIYVDYAKTVPEGVMAPMVLEIQGPSGASYKVREYLRTAPTSVVVKPREGGKHFVTLREAAHNRWWGGIGFEVKGDQL